MKKPLFKKIETELIAHLLRLKNEQKLDNFTYTRLRSTDATQPAIRGSVKHHKQNYPLLPIVSCIDSALYNTSTFLCNLLKPPQNSNGYSVANSTDFKNKISDTTIDEDEIMLFHLLSPIERCRLVVESS